MRNMRKFPDTFLEEHFSEHPWREPVKLRAVDRRQDQAFLSCRFCLYRWGDWRSLTDGRLPRFADDANARAHLALEHPIDPWRIKPPLADDRDRMSRA